MIMVILHDDGDDFDKIFRSGSIGHGLSLKCVRWLRRLTKSQIDSQRLNCQKVQVFTDTRTIEESGKKIALFKKTYFLQLFVENADKVT